MKQWHFLVVLILTFMSGYFCASSANTSADTILADSEIAGLELSQSELSERKSTESSKTEAQQINLISNKKYASEGCEFSQIVSNTNSNKNEYSNQMGISGQIKNNELANVATMSLNNYNQLIAETENIAAEHLILTLPSYDLDEMLQQYNNEDEFSDSASLYRDQIINFIASNNSSDIYPDSLECKVQYCKLEITVNDEKQWQQTFSELSHQAWWQSVAFTANDSTNPNAKTLVLMNQGIAFNSQNSEVIIDEVEGYN